MLWKFPRSEAIIVICKCFVGILLSFLISFCFLSLTRSVIVLGLYFTSVLELLTQALQAHVQDSLIGALERTNASSQPASVFVTCVLRHPILVMVRREGARSRGAQDPQFSSRAALAARRMAQVLSVVVIADTVVHLAALAWAGLWPVQRSLRLHPHQNGQARNQLSSAAALLVRPLVLCGVWGIQVLQRQLLAALQAH